jgi:hypothetical protein
VAHQETSRGDWADTTFNPCSSACWQAAGPIVSIQCNLEGRGLTAPPVSPVGAICLREHPVRIRVRAPTKMSFAPYDRLNTLTFTQSVDLARLWHTYLPHHSKNLRLKLFGFSGFPPASLP